MAPGDRRIDNAFYDRLGDRWYTAHDDPVALLRSESRALAPWVIARMPPRGARVLDVGCGAGFLSNRLAGEGFRVHGIDLSPESLEVARRYDTTASVVYSTSDAYALPFGAAEFDAVTAMDFLEHVAEPEKIIAEISRVLKPGGLFFFHTFNRSLLTQLVVIKLVEWFVANTPKRMHVRELFIKPAELGAYCARQGLEVKEMTGLKPCLSTLTWRGIRTRSVPEGFEFALTKSRLISYLGCARKRP
jgi:2-polyprenyl-6-hydroxyphenyl methylase/3-demethylubiquinone-9 3-methyltransferase